MRNDGTYGPDASQVTPRAGIIGDDLGRASNRTHQHYIDEFVGDGGAIVFTLSKTPVNSAQLQVFVAGLKKRRSVRNVPNDYTLTGNKITFQVAPPLGAYVDVHSVAP